MILHQFELQRRANQSVYLRVEKSWVVYGDKCEPLNEMFTGTEFLQFGELVSQQERICVNDSESTIRLFRMIFDPQAQFLEHFYMAALNSRSEVLGIFDIAMGSSTYCTVSVKEVVLRAVLLNAASIVVAHNHPTGNSMPSRDDYKITALLKAACDTFQISLLNHLIFGESVHKVDLSRCKV